MLSLTLSPSHWSKSLTLFTLTLSLTFFSHSLLSHSQSPLSVSTISQSSPSPKDLIKPQQALSSFSLCGLSKLKKKRWVALYQVHCLVAEKHAWKIKETLVSRSSFLFWFLYWISNKTVKKDRSFIVFWDWIGLWVWFYFLFFWVLFCALFYLWVELLISGKFHTQILNHALFCSDDVRVC